MTGSNWRPAPVARRIRASSAPWSPVVIEDFKARLGKYVVFKGCFQVPVDWKMDRKLVKDLVKARLRELD